MKLGKVAIDGRCRTGIRGLNWRWRAGGLGGYQQPAAPAEPSGKGNSFDGFFSKDHVLRLLRRTGMWMFPGR